MQSIISIVILLLLGLVLIIAELIFIPGVTVVGVIGLIFSVMGMIFTFQVYDTAIGLYVLGGYLFLLALAVFYSLKSGAWKKLALHNKIDSRVNEEEGIQVKVKVGDTGKTVSALRPGGKAEFNDLIVEVRTFGDYVDSGTKVKIARIDTNNIFVETLN